MKKIYIYFIAVLVTSFGFAQSEITITTSGGSFPGEKWVSITTAIDGGGAQIWGQGDGTQCNGSGLLTAELVSLAPGTYYVNCYDQYDDSWDGTLITVDAYGTTIGDNGGTSPTDGADTDVDGTCEGTAEELESSFAIIVPAPPACPDPSAITVDSFTDTTAEISWTAGGTETDWEIVVQADGLGTPGGAGTATTSNPYSSSGLTAETAYEIYVRADCGGSGLSGWAGPVDFTTACGAETAPYTEDFESAGALPNCWTLAGDDDWEFNTSGPNHVGNGGTLSGSTTSGNYYAVLDDSDPTSTNGELRSPLVDLSGLTTEGLSFYLISDNEGQASATLTVDVWDGAAWNTVGTYSGNTSGWEEQIIDISGLTFTGNAQVRFLVADSGSFYDDIAIDDVRFYELPSCLDPTALAASSVGETTASIGWTAGASETDWEIVVQADGLGTPGGAGTATTSNPYAATGLTASTAYEVYLRADCGAGGLSAWVGPVDFTTTAAAVTTFPYDEDFDAGAGGWIADNTTNGSWELGAPANLAINSADSGTDAWVTDLDGDYLANDDSWVTSPPFDMSGLTAPVIEMSVWYESEFSWDGMVLQSSIDGGTSWQNVGAQGDPTNWFNDGTIGGNPGGQAIGWTGSSAGWLAASHELTGLGGQASVFLRVAFAADGSGQDEGAAFDSVSIYDPACPDLSGLTIDSFTDATAEISWTAGGTETDWEVLVQADGTGSPAGGVATTSNPYSATGLTGNTAYEVYVRADCGGAEFSNWVGPVDFTTACGPIVPDYTADMSNNAPDACWTEANDGEVAAGPTGLGASDWTTGSYVFGNSNRINLYDFSDDREWLLSPVFDLSADGYELIVNVGVTNWNSSTVADAMGSDDEVRLLQSIDGGTTWTTLTTWTAADALQPSGTSYTEDLTGTTGTDVRFAIWASDGIVDDPEDYDFHIGEFEVREIPACPDVSAVMVSNIGTTTADVAWTNGGSETAWEVAIQAQGTGTPASGAASATNPYNATGLTAQTDYEVYVRSDCGGGAYGAWAGPIDFSTACNTFALPLVEGFESGVPPACWSSFRGTNGEGTGFDWTTNGFSNSGASAAFVRYENVATAAEDWLVTPALDMSTATNPELSFYASQDFAGAFGSVYTVRVSTTNTDHASFTTVETYTEADFSVDLYDQYIVDLSAYASEATVYVAFVMDNDDGDNWYLDDVLIYDNVPTTFTYTSGTWAPFNPMGLATADDDVIIAAGDVMMSADLSCNTMTVNPGAGLTVDTGATLTTVAGTTLESSSTSYSSLILDGTVAGAMAYERHVNMNGSGSTGSNDLVSAPLTGQAFNTFATANPNILNNGTLYLFGPFEKVTGQYVNWAGTETTTLEAGVGYRTGTTDNGDLIFSGTAENTTVTNDIQNAGSNNAEWNLVGNPYPSYLNLQDFLNHDVGGVTNLQLFDAGTAAIYGYDGSALNGWKVLNLANTTASTVIAPGQGFFVSADATNAPVYDVEFTAAMRSTGSSDDFIAGRNAELIYVKLKASTASDTFGTEIYFNNNASLGFDLGYDAELWSSTTPDFSLYSHLIQDNAGKSMALQTLSSTDLNDVTIPLGVNANLGEQLTFSIADMTLPATVKVYLEDVVANTVTLLNNSDYVITPTTALSGTGRFFLRTSQDALSNVEYSIDKLDIFTLKASDELVVNGQLSDSNNAILNLFDIQGRLVLTTELDNTSLQNRINVSSINAGVYIVTVQDNGHEKTKKVIIN